MQKSRAVVMAAATGWTAASLLGLYIQKSDEKKIQKLVKFQHSLVDALVAYEQFVPDAVVEATREQMQFDAIVREIDG